MKCLNCNTAVSSDYEQCTVCNYPLNQYGEYNEQGQQHVRSTENEPKESGLSLLWWIPILWIPVAAFFEYTDVHFLEEISRIMFLPIQWIFGGLVAVVILIGFIGALFDGGGSSRGNDDDFPGEGGWWR